MSDQQQQQQQPDPQGALNFLDGILGGVPGSRKDHIAIQGAIGIIAEALRPAKLTLDETIDADLG